MSKIYVTPAHFESKFQIAPAQVVFHRSISSDAKILILALNQIKHSAPNWVVIQEDLQHRLCFGRDKMKKAMAEAMKYGYLRIRQVRQEKGKVNAKGEPVAGQFRRNDFEFNIEANFDPLPETLSNVDEIPQSGQQLPLEAPEPSPEKPSTANPSTVNQPLPMPDKPMPRLKALKGNASLFKNPRALEASPSQQPAGKSAARKFPRTEEKENAYQWLLGIELLYKDGLPDINTLSVLANKYTSKKLEDTYFHLIHKINEQGVKARSPMAFYRHLLENEHNCKGTDAQLNEAYAKHFANDMKWHTLEFKDRYVIDRNYPSKDIDFNLEPATFRQILGDLYFNANGNFGT